MNLVPGGTIEQNDQFKITLTDAHGDSHTLTVSASGATPTVSSVVADITTAFNNSTDPRFAAITAVNQSTYVQLTGDGVGISIHAEVATTESDGSPADLQTFTQQSATPTGETSTVNRQAMFQTYDNLNQVATVEGFDADSFAIDDGFNDGQPDAPLSSSRRAKTAYDYDIRGRRFATYTYSVNASDGQPSSSSLATYTWYDRRGNVMKIQEPGGKVTKNLYDGVGRLSKTYITDASDDTPAKTSGTWTDAASVSGDTVLEQTEYQYDDSGNVVLTTSKARFHDETATGELASHGSAPKARVSYTGFTHDAANRLVASLNVGAVAGKATSATSNTLTDTTRSEPTGSFAGYTIVITSGTGSGQQRRVIAYNGTTDTFTVDSNWTTTPDTTSYYALLPSAAVTGKATSAGSNTLTDSSRTEATDYFKDHWIIITSGTGQGQRKRVTAYNGTTDTFTVDSNWTVTPDTTSSYALLPDGLLTNHTYDGAGRVESVTDPRGKVRKTTYDVLGRVTKTIENYVDGTASNADDRITEYTYNGNSDVLTMKAVLPSSAFQTTQYIYGLSQSISSITNPSSGVAEVTTTAAHGYKVGQSVSISGSNVSAYNGTWTISAVPSSTTFRFSVTGSPGSASSGTARPADDLWSNDILSAVRYPDKSSGSASTAEQEVFTYNALGDRKTAADRNGNVHAYDYDVLGRLTGDYVSALGSGVIGSVRELRYTYTEAGQLHEATSYGERVNGVPGSGTIANQVKKAYNGLGQLTTEWQEHSNDVDVLLSERVQYTYSEMAGGANHSRLTKITYPVTGRIVRYEYNSGVDANTSRVSFLADDASGSVGTHLEEYSYIGWGTVVKRNHPEPDTALTYIDTVSGEAGDQYVGLDRFGRIIDQRWDDTDSATDTDRFKYGYDENGNVLYKDNMLTDSLSGASDLDELYHADGATAGYDGLNRLTDFQRGELSDPNSDGIPDTITTAARTQAWTLDALGNWSTISTDGTPASRTHNRQNQITNTGFVHDNNGNLKQSSTDSNPPEWRYDAWNRMVEYKTRGSGINATIYNYPFDALHRRVKQDQVQIGGSPYNQDKTELYYSDRWQVIAETQVQEPSEQSQPSRRYERTYVWTPGYIDEMVERDEHATIVDPGQGTSETDTRLYAQQDANFNVTSVTDTSGAVQERYLYDPYGLASYFNASWSALGGSGVNWVYLHQGGRYDAISGLYHFRNRDYNPTLGRWMQQDPAGYFDGANRYQYELGAAVAHLDPLGLTVDLVDYDESIAFNVTTKTEVIDTSWEFFADLTYSLGVTFEDANQEAHTAKFFARAEGGPQTPIGNISIGAEYEGSWQQWKAEITSLAEGFSVSYLLERKVNTLVERTTFSRLEFWVWESDTADEIDFIPTMPDTVSAKLIYQMSRKLENCKIRTTQHVLRKCYRDADERKEKTNTFRASVKDQIVGTGSSDQVRQGALNDFVQRAKAWLNIKD
ncbi:RHS repeat-associated core domain-containing protein [Fontivita pretiosa]|uniref:RHS repeat-associated core domain-containing protein n=1 Tax=Fontivita pretiosa TaxID=2989684 RepID=UPI003D1650AA